MKNFLVSVLLVCMAAVTGLVSVAQAAVPAGVETVFTTTATDFGTILGYGWTLVLVVIGGLALIKLGKKVFYKST
jgi:hypothetical protein